MSLKLSPEQEEELARRKAAAAERHAAAKERHKRATAEWAAKKNAGEGLHPSIGVVMGVVAVALVVVGFIGWQSIGSSDEQTGPSPASQTQESSSNDSRTQDDLLVYLRDGFSDTRWYRYITDISVHGSSADVTTSLYDDSDATEPARAICGAVLFSDIGGIEYVRVTDPGGVRIVQGGNTGFRVEACG